MLEPHPCAEVDALAVAAPALGVDVDDHHAFEPLTQETHASVDLVQPFLAVSVLGVLRAIALRGGGGDRCRDARPFIVPELVELIAQPFCAFRRDVFGPYGRGWTVS